jgi:hypothetical protein
VVKKVIWLQRLLREIGLDQKTVTININNKGAIDYAKNAQFSQRTKHIDIKHHFIQDHLNKEEIKLAYILSQENIADILTKSLDKTRFKKLRKQIGIKELREIVSNSTD